MPSVEGYVSFQSDPDVIWDLYPTLTGRRAFDIGANGGAVANILAREFAEVVAFEPHHTSFAEMHRSHHRGVTPVYAAISNRTGPVMLNVATLADRLGEYVTGNSLPSSWGEQTGTVEIHALSLPDAVREYGEPDFIKIDTEGHEWAIIRGGAAWLNRHKPRLLIEVHDESQGMKIHSALGAYSFTRVDHPAYLAIGAREMARNHYWLHWLGDR